MYGFIRLSSGAGNPGRGTQNSVLQVPLEGSITIGSIDSSGNLYHLFALLYPRSTVPKGMRNPSGVHFLYIVLNLFSFYNINVIISLEVQWECANSGEFELF